MVFLSQLVKREDSWVLLARIRANVLARIRANVIEIQNNVTWQDT